MRSMAIIGNAPEFRAASNRIDGYDHVVRFNNTAGLGDGSGTKTSELVLVSRGGQPAEWLADPAFTDRRAVREAGLVTLVFPPSAKAEDACHADALRQRLALAGKESRWIAQAVQDAARLALLAHGASPSSALSSGYLYTFMAVTAADRLAGSIDVFGFGFDGWDGHAWAAERAWFEEAHRAGQLVLHAPGRP